MLVCFTWIVTSGFQTNGGGVRRVMQFMGMSVAGGDTGREEGEAPVSISTHPRQCPPPSQFDKYQKSTRNENASNFLRCQGPFVCSVHFAGFSPAFVPLSQWMASGTYALHRYRLALARPDVGSSHVMLLTATPHLPLWQTRI